MKSFRSRRRHQMPPEAQQLQKLANGLAESGCRAEDDFWERQIDTLLDQLLEQGEEDLLNGALDAAFEDPRLYDVLAESIESRAELAHDGERTVLLIAAPVLAWSRVAIPAGRIPAAMLQSLRVQLQAHVLANDIPLALADRLLSPEQLPQGFCETARLCAAMRAPVAAGGTLAIEDENLPEAARFLSDVRYVLAAIACRPGEPMFRWQEGGTRAQALEQWRKQGGAVLSPLLAGCAYELGLPDAYFSACRQADRSSRPFSIMASVDFLSTTLDVTPAQMRATVALFSDNEVEEYRVGFAIEDKPGLVHGVVWPLLGPEETTDSLAQLEAALRDNGLTQIQMLEQHFPIEYCDDCGAPLYPSAEGDALHAELPEESAGQVPRHLH
ncbi:MAG: DUF2863 family protein [Candidatus Dactylopiibacterium sp.]|nr:DUF2863 family protein [Candidatus Dactylopiibacterium sp.]